MNDLAAPASSVSATADQSSRSAKTFRVPVSARTRGLDMRPLDRAPGVIGTPGPEWLAAFSPPPAQGPLMSETLVRRVPLSEIDTSDRLRPVDIDRAQAIAESMAVGGLQQPIVIRPIEPQLGFRYALVIGGHRTWAAVSLGWTEIEARIEDLTDLQARLAEIDENLYRHELSALDRAVFLSERKRVWEQLNPETAHGANRDKEQGKSMKFARVANLATRFTTEAAEKLGISERSIRRACQIADQLSPEVVALVRKTYLVGHQGDLEKLIRFAEPKQIEALQRLASGEVKTLAGAFGRTERNVGDRLFDAFTTLWKRAPSKVQRRMLGYVGIPPAMVDEIVNPKGTKLLAAE